ncbi:MAG: molybdopterin molybdotransferase MoeA [Proteobacteria bacterium]|nr:molybdopterin molybdotransferase MoeA [Pseudomonadota bacterium]
MTVLQRLETSGCGCDATDMSHGLVPIDTALSTGLALTQPVTKTEVLPLSQSLGRVLAAPVLAQSMTPPFDNSGMDGYAVRVADLTGQGPWTLPVMDRIAAGDNRTVKLPHGCAMRIFTGAPLPEGADAVIMQERVALGQDAIDFSHSPALGENIRRAGEDMALDAEVLPAGRTIGVRALAAAASAGAGQLTVFSKLRIALLMTGDEVVPAGQALSHGTIWDVNTPMMVAALSVANIEITAVERVQDSLEEMTKALRRLSSQVDMIITTGGVSVGDEDHAHNALRDAGGKIAVAGVAIKPGKPITIGQIDNTIYIGLPGNPVSAFVTWSIFGAPILEKLSGASKGIDLRRHVVASKTLSHKLGRCEFRPAMIVGHQDNGIEVVETLSAVHSARLGPLTNADGMVLIPGDTESIAKGGLLEFLSFGKS